MGMGDAKKSTEPKTRYLRCSVCGHVYAEYTSRDCPHPAVQRKYGNANGIARVCYYCCKKCEFAVKVKFIDSYDCIYTKKDGGESAD